MRNHALGGKGGQLSDSMFTNPLLIYLKLRVVPILKMVTQNMLRILYEEK